MIFPAAIHREDLGVVQEAVEDGRSAGDVAQEFASVFQRAVAGHHGGAGLVGDAVLGAGAAWPRASTSACTRPRAIASDMPSSSNCSRR